MEKNSILVLYHVTGPNSRCLDGFMAATAVYDHYVKVLEYSNCDDPRNEIFDYVEFRGVQYNTPISDLTGKYVYIVDFSYPPEELIKAAETADRVIVIDHHDTAFKAWTEAEPTFEFTVDEFPGSEYNSYGKTWQYKNVCFHYFKDLSGGVATWRYFNFPSGNFRNLVGSEPQLYKNAQDHDLFNHELDFTREIVASLYYRLPTMEIPNMSNLVQVIEDQKFQSSPGKLHELITEGQVLADQLEGLADSIIKQSAFYATAFGYEGIPVCPCPRVFRTTVGSRLAKGHPFSITFEDNFATGIREYSLRCDKKIEDHVKVNALLKEYRGGGHTSAAGCKTKITDPYLFNPLADKAYL